VIAVAAVAATWLLGRTRFFHLIHIKAPDLHFLARGARPPSDIVLLVIDQKSLDQFPEPLLFWHPYYAEAIRASAAAGAKVFGLDVTFPIPVEQWAPGHDQLLAEAVIAASPRMPVICSYVPSMVGRQADWPVPVNLAVAALGQAAFANLRVDPDDFVRSVELIEEPAAGQDAPLTRSVALGLAEKFLGAQARFEEGELHLAGHLIPTAGRRTITINYPGPAGTFPRVSLCDFLSAAREGRTDQLQRWVAGKAVLLGKDMIDDRHATPFYTLSPGLRANTAGVEIHAAALSTLLTRRYLQEAPQPARFAALFAPAAAIAAVAATLGAWTVGAFVAGGAALTILLTHLLFRAGWMLSPSEVILAGLLALLFTLTYRFFTAEKRGAVFYKAIGMFVGKKLAKTLAETESIALSGSRQMLTILFSDIRGFTSFCEEKDPAVVVELLNEYLSTMVAIIIRHQGHANKFIGDGIMAIFSDEDGTVAGDHAVRAARCGRDMAAQPHRFRTGVGIHSGVALVGNIGSADKMEYTALGDTVNMASRLESLNKEHKTRLLMSEATHLMLDGALDTMCLGEVVVRGTSAPMKIFTLPDLMSGAPEAVASGKTS
jgi:class 3 adenylate cyclase/CHASE2 domain-containing sensor protein